MVWIVVAYFFFAVAELFISPIGQAMVGSLSPEGMEGSLMGAWQLFTGLSGVISGFLAQFAVVPEHAKAIASNPTYMTAFAKIGLMTVVLGVISLFLVRYIKRLIGENATFHHPH